MAKKFDYARMAKTANRLIDKFGKSGAIRRTTDDSGNPWDPGQSTTDYPCTLAVTQFTLKERESSLIGETDKKVYIAVDGLAIEPANSDEVVVDGTAHEIVRIDPIKPAETVVAYMAQVTF